MGTWVQVVPDVESYSSEGQDLARAVRAQAAPVPILVGGPSARLVDTGGRPVGTIAARHGCSLLDDLARRWYAI